MDIKDFILIGGGILIAMVIGHGFWIAWRAKREPLRIDIVPDLIPDDMDEIERLRGELPNGGARVVHSRATLQPPENLELDLAAPVLMEPVAEVQQAIEPEVSATRPATGFTEPKKLRAQRPKVHQAPPRKLVVEDEAQEPVVDAQATRAHVREVQIELDPLVPESPVTTRTKTTSRRDVVKSQTDQTQTGRTKAGQNKAGQSKVNRGSVGQAKKESEEDAVAVEELLIVNILAPRGEPFDGESLVHALRRQGLRYGDMNIFHRVDPATKAKLYSVANAVEPGTFDLSDLSSMQSPGMTFFLQLPGPDDAISMFEDMLQAARSVSVELGGDLRDENLSGLTGQTVEHMRQRIADFARRRLSKRA